MVKSIGAKLALLIFLCSPIQVLALTANAKNDPFPMYSTLDPQQYLNTWHRMRLSNIDVGTDAKENISISLAGFGQNANSGKDIDGNKRNLGDIINNGRFFMVGLIFGNVPTGKTLAPLLVSAKSTLEASSDTTDAQKTDPCQEFGYFTIPLKYRKKGGRLDMHGQIFRDLGVSFQLGLADICQTVTGFVDLTEFSDFPDEAHPSGYTRSNVETLLMDQLCPIAEEIDLNICNYHEVGAEDIRINGYWRHTFAVNQDRKDWPAALITPFVQLGGAFAAGKKTNPNKAFALPFGSDFNSVGVSGGIDIDFVGTIVIGGEVGWTHFFKRKICDMPIPTSKFQSGIFPFSTDVNYQPGGNWSFAAKIGSYHFLDNLSFYFQYVMVNHQDDDIDLCTPDTAFMPEVLEKTTTWKTKLANVAFNYDISPNVGLGFLWQAPLNQKNSYKSTTLMLSFYTIF